MNTPEITIDSVRKTREMAPQREEFFQRMLDTHEGPALSRALLGIIKICHRQIDFVLEELDKAKAIDVEFETVTNKQL